MGVWRPETSEEQAEPLQGGRCEIWFRLMKRAAAVPNARTGTERVTFNYNLAKTKLSCSTKNGMVLTRIRVKCNGPPLSMFNQKQVRQLRLKYGHHSSICKEDIQSSSGYRKNPIQRPQKLQINNISLQYTTLFLTMDFLS